MSDLALRLIAENKASHERGEDTAKYLDLGNCSLTTLPEELFELDWLEELIAGHVWWDERKKEMVQSENEGPKNTLTDLGPLEKLTGLQSLHLRGNLISDLRPLEKLTGLQSIDLRYNQISDLGLWKNSPACNR